ncbi:MAG: hypothetical protein ACOCQQ_03165 [Candidatus Nanoarchaeia archaeon]
MKLLWTIVLIGLLFSTFFLISCSTQDNSLLPTSQEDGVNLQSFDDSVNESIDQAILPEDQEIEIGEMI